MSWNYRRRIKLFPGVHLNISKSGISTSIGVKGASLTVGKSGTYLNTRVPGIGLYNRKKLSGTPSPAPRKDISYQPRVIENTIFSLHPHEITSHDMQGVKDAILAAYQQRKELLSEIAAIKSTIRFSRFKLILSYALLYGLVVHAIPDRIRQEIEAQEHAMSQLGEHLEDCGVGMVVEFDQDISALYEQVLGTFNKLRTSTVISDVIGEQTAGGIVYKRPIQIGFKSIPEIQSATVPMWFRNFNGADLYFYPNFLIVYNSIQEFAVIGLDELQFGWSQVLFREAKTIPADSHVVGSQWLIQNKDGSPDRRFKSNYQVPVVRYGEITLGTVNGLNEKYEFSNYEFTEAFGRAFREYQQVITSLKRKLP